jgi:hypothetical protein
MARCHTYFWHNVCLIASQWPTATRVAGLQTWRTLGRFVREGEQGIAIMELIVRRCEAEGEAGADHRRLPGGVFDVQQTDGGPLSETTEPSGDPGAKTAALKNAILERGIALESVDDLDGALGTSSGGRIRLRSSLSPATEFTTLADEYAH